MTIDGIVALICLILVFSIVLSFQIALLVILKKSPNARLIDAKMKLSELKECTKALEENLKDIEKELSENQ